MNIQSLKAAYGAMAFDSPARSGKKAAPEKPAAARNEQVEISDESLNLQKLRDAVQAAPDVRLKLVEEIQTKIRHNGYPLETNLYKAVESLVEHRII